MSVPVPPPPDGVLTGTSDSLEAGEPTLGTAVWGKRLPTWAGTEWVGLQRRLPCCLGPPRAATWVPQGNAQLCAVRAENLRLCCLLTVIGSVVGDEFVRKTVDFLRPIKYWLLMKYSDLLGGIILPVTRRYLLQQRSPQFPGEI